ncbi:putative aminoglycoside phosphotransferase protein [Rosellinia necatrix]|uniref:Putative aminoglycoside phosphotransferase protein n=1 Tax=Rosellinia necatrix TaxID=77044 RepID=A0A1W2TR88_ROSNE|nr:putative aminoglycoside phosphotransferase protein [Rosellinia necatrix]
MADTIVNQRPLVGTPSLTRLGGAPVPLGPHQLPAVGDEVTPEWLSSVLGVKVKSIQRTGELPGTATKMYITAKNDNGERRLCLKGGFDPVFIQQMPWIVMIYQREVEFFNRIAPMLTDMDLPQALWAGYTPTQGIVVMEDLAARGCEFGSPVETWPVHRVRAGVEQLAALHAKTWGVHPVDYPWLTSDYDQALLTLMRTYDAVVNGPDRPSIPAYLRDQDRVTAVLKKHYASRNPKFRCLLHGDAHLGNTYLDGGAPRFLDWQMIHIGSAFHDVSYYIGGALSIEDRRAHEWELVDHYLATLTKLGVRDNLKSTDADLRNEYRKSFLAGIGWLMCPYQMQPRDCVHAMAARYAAALDDHNVLELVESLPEPDATT